MTKYARTYGGALFDLAKEEGLESTIMEDLKLVSEMFSEIEGYCKLLQSPALDASERSALLDEAWDGRIHKYSLNFLKMLCDQGNAGEFPECAEEYRRLYNDAYGIASARLKCAAPLSDELLSRLKAALEKRLQKKVELEVEVDESLIGGLLLDVDGMRFDGSIANHLAELKKLLA